MKRYELALIPLGPDRSLIPLRQNNGDLTIMERDEENDHSRPCLLIPRFASVKRTEAASAPDPEQEAFAQRVIDLLNDEELLVKKLLAE